MLVAALQLRNTNDSRDEGSFLLLASPFVGDMPPTRLCALLILSGTVRLEATIGCE